MLLGRTRTPFLDVVVVRVLVFYSTVARSYSIVPLQDVTFLRLIMFIIK